MSRIISKSAVQALLTKIQGYELQYFVCAQKLEHLKNQLDFAHLCYKREILGLSDQEQKDFENLSKKIEGYEEVLIK